MDLSAGLVIAGIVIMIAGLLFLAFAPKPAQLADAQSAVTDAAALVKEIGAFLNSFESRFRVGIAVMFFGLALVGAGLYLEVNDAKTAAKDAKAAATTPAALEAARPPTAPRTALTAR